MYGITVSVLQTGYGCFEQGFSKCFLCLAVVLKKREDGRCRSLL